eukprot:Em0022g67a
MSAIGDTNGPAHHPTCSQAIVWDVRHCSVLRVLEGHTGAVFSVDLDESSELAFTASGDKTVGVWQLSSGLCLKRLKHTNGLPVVALQWQETTPSPPSITCSLHSPVADVCRPCLVMQDL